MVIIIKINNNITIDKNQLRISLFKNTNWPNINPIVDGSARISVSANNFEWLDFVRLIIQNPKAIVFLMFRLGFYRNLSYFFYLTYSLYIFIQINIILQFQIEMATNLSKTRDNRKAKTSILFEVKNNVDQNVEISQSINIISLNTPAKYIKTSASENANSKPEYYSNGNINGKNNGRRAHHSGKLTIKLNSGNCIGWDDYRNPSVYKSQSSKKIEVTDMIEKFQKRNLIVVQRNRIISQITSFSRICTEFVEKIDGLKEENCQLSGKVKKYENYFKELKIKQVPEAFDTILEPTKCEKNAQLKILNLQRKVQTLAYIIKNYRQNNKEEVKQFEKRIFEYRPSIQSQLVEMLGQANKKNENLRKTVQHFQQEYKKYFREGKWVELAMQLKEKDELINRLDERAALYEQENFALKKQRENIKNLELQQKLLGDEIKLQKNQIKDLKMTVQNLRESSMNKDDLYGELFKAHQELTYQFQGIKNMEAKYKEKEEIVKRNLVTITRLQNQNNHLKSKINKISEINLFEEAETIQKCNSTIDDLTNRFWEEMDRLPSKNEQSISFLSHLYDKTKTSFEKIVDEYRKQIKELSKQKKQLKSLLQSIIEANNKRFQFTQEMVQQVQNIQAKRNRCWESQLKVQICESCPSCNSWASHWGQINHLYSQLEGFVHKLSQISSR